METTPLLPPKQAADSPSPPKKLATFDGVFLPTTLNVLSILMFLRFGFILGQMGISGLVLLLVMSYLIDTLTVLSISAISTNGTVKGGGAYYMILRSLGPEFGGAIGIIFFIGQILNASLNVVGLVEAILVNFGNIQGDVYPLLPVSYAWLVLYSLLVLLACTAVTLVGASFVSKTAFWLFVLLVSSTLSIPVLAIFAAPGYPLPPPNDQLWYLGLLMATFRENLWPKFTSGAAGSVLPPGEKESFKNLFGVFFPATAGIFAGALMSGDLQNPSRSIPKGTLSGLFASFWLYFVVILALGASVPRELFLKDIKIIQSVSLSGLVIILGEAATALFSVIMGIVGAASMFNAIACDRIVPGLGPFSLSKKLSLEKQKAINLSIFLTWIIAQAFLFADINSIATFITMAFLTTFFVTNLACFLLRVGSAPNFRPSFKWFSSKTAGTGGIVSVLAMYLVDGWSATSVITFLIFLMVVIHYSVPPLTFGDISQLLIYHQVRKYLLRLKVDMSVKCWRPQILLLCDDPRSSWSLIAFCNHLKKGGLYILGHVVRMPDTQFDVTSVEEIKKQKHAWSQVRDIARIKAFVQIAVSPSLPWGVRNVFLGSGLGGMKPNITVLGFYDSQKHGVSLPLRNEHLPTDECRKESKVSVNQWVQIVEDLIIMQATVAVAGNFAGMTLPELRGRRWFRSLPEQKHPPRYIDLYPIQMSSVCFLNDGKSVMSTNFDTYTLILQLGAILSTVDEWAANGYRLRVVAFVETEAELDDEYRRLADLLSSLRIDAEVHVKFLDDGLLSTYNFLVKGHVPTKDTQKEFDRVCSILHGDRWWSNLCDARETLCELKRSRNISRRSGKWGFSGRQPHANVSLPISLSKSSSGVTAGSPRLRNNRRYTLSNLHNQGLSLSFNMRAHGDDGFFNYGQSDSDSDTSEAPESSGELPQQAGPHVNSNSEEVNSEVAESGNSGSKPHSRSKRPLLLRYHSHLGSVDQISTKSSTSNLRPSFLAVKIPQSKLRDDGDDDGDEGTTENSGDNQNKRSIGFIGDNIPSSAAKDRLRADSPMNPPSVIASDDINHHIHSPQFLSEDDNESMSTPLPTAEERKVTPKQLNDELANLSFNDIPAKGQHVILNELIKNHSRGDTAVVFSTLPAPVFGTHLDDAASLDYTNSIAIWLDGLPPTLLVNSQTVTVTTAL